MIRIPLLLALLVAVGGGCPVPSSDLHVAAITPYAAPDGFCSLVEAIDNANDDAATHADCPAGSGADTIALSGDVTLDGSALFTANGPNGLPSITSPIRIEGDGHAIRRDPAAPAFRLLHVSPAGDLTLVRTTLENGLVESGFDDGGALYNAGTLTLRGATIRDSEVRSVFPSGGGLYNAGIATLVDSLVAGNRTADDTFSQGGGLYNALEQEIVLVNTVVRDNTATVGGGLYSFGFATVQNGTFRGNVARETGGAMLVGRTLDPAHDRVRVSNSVFDDNEAAEGGGAVLTGSRDCEIFASTFTRNRATASGVGGAIQNTGGHLTVTASTFQDNAALGGALGGAIANLQLGEVHLAGSTVRGNRSDTGGGAFYTSLAEFHVRDSLVEGNEAPRGGGFYQGPSNVDAFFVQRSAVIGNLAGLLGGGAYLEGNLSRSHFHNTTFSGNVADQLGGAVALNQGGQAELVHTTVADNETLMFINGIGGLNLFAGEARLGADIIAHNPTGDCSATSQSQSLGHNITTGPAGGIPPDRWCSFIPLQPTDQTATDPLLAPLAENGNVGPSYLLQPGSPAIDAVPADCPPELGGVDQRGVARPPGSCDVGATSSQAADLPLVYFASPASTLDDEGSVVGPHEVELVVDNTAGNLAAPAMDLTLYVGVRGSAALDTDYAAAEPVPTVVTVDAAAWPAPGTARVVPLAFTVLDDLLPEDDETIELSVSLTGPGLLGAPDAHVVTVLDDDGPPELLCQGFFPPFAEPLEITRRSRRTIPVKMVLLDATGAPQGPADLPAAPEITVQFGGLVYGDPAEDDAALEPVGRSNPGNRFAWDEEAPQWGYRLGTSQLPEPGSYTVTVRSGDPDAYTLGTGDGAACTQTFTRR